MEQNLSTIPEDAYEPPPPPDPRLIQRKKTIRFILQIGIGILFCGILLRVFDFLVKESQKDNPFKYTPVIIKEKQNTDLISVIGVVRTSGLSDDEKNLNDLNTILYQLTDFGLRNQQQIPGYFLQGDGPTLEKNLGKCVKITGTVPAQWKNKTLPYQRSYIVISDIKALDYSNCDAYMYSSESSSSSTFQSFSGTIERTQRPAPDIGYDYLLNLDKPFISSNSASGLLETVKQLTIAPINDTLWKQIETFINKSVIITGEEKWGFAESKYILVSGVEEKKDTIDLSNQTYFVDTTDWHLFENTDCKFTFKKPTSFTMSSEILANNNIDIPKVEGAFEDQTSSNWLNMSMTCSYNDGKIPLKQLANQTNNTPIYVKETTLQEKRGYIRLEKTKEGTRTETYYVNMDDGRVFTVSFTYSPFSSYLPIARTVLATIIFK